MSAAKPSSDETVLAALGSRQDVTTADVAQATGLGRSTVAKALSRLERAGRVRRRAGGRDGGRRSPDRWALATPVRPARRGSRGRRLRSGELDGLVVDYLAANARHGPLSPTAVANGLGRSSGAVGNCLARLTTAKRVRQVSERPRRYLPT